VWVQENITGKNKNKNPACSASQMYKGAQLSDGDVGHRVYQISVN